MPIVFAAAMSHAPGITAWTEAAPEAQREAILGAFARLRERFAAAKPEAVIALTSEHWTNFFLDHIGPYCVGMAASYAGPVEPWLRVEKSIVPGDVELANALVEAAYDAGIEPNFAHEMVLDHGTMVPLHFLNPVLDVPIVPVMFNTLAAPQPSATRAYDFGTAIGEVARRSPKRIAVIATGGMSHDPGERRHGQIDAGFDRAFLERMATGDAAALRAYRREDFTAAGAGAFELLAWIALAGALRDWRGETLAYEAVVPWATGCGVMAFAPP